MADRGTARQRRAPLERAATGAAGEPLPAPLPLQGSVSLLDGRRVLNMDVYVPAYLAIVNNRLSRGASRTYLRRFGIGIGEWRLLALLALEPGIPAARLREYLGMDKALVSRALARLDQQGYLSAGAAAGADSRRKTWRLSESGYALHEAILQVALEREARLLTGVTPAQKEAFLVVARKMMANLPLLEKEE